MSTPITDPDGTIPVPVAKEWAENWRTFLSTSEQEFVTRSFMVPICDFQNILLYNPDAEYVRAYIGLESATDPLSAKLMLVPVTDGSEIHVIPGTLGDAPKSNVYDLTTSCPPTCVTTPPGDTLDT